MAGESYPQHSEGDTVESRDICPCSAGRCLSALLSMLGHANFEITSPISGPQLCSFSSYDKILCSVNAPSFGFPFGSLTNPGNHHFPSNKLQVLQSAHGFNAAVDRPTEHPFSNPTDMDTHARFSQFVEKHVDQAEYGEEGRRGSLLSRLNTWVDFNHRQTKFEVAGLVIKKS